MSLSAYESFNLTYSSTARHLACASQFDEISKNPALNPSMKGSRLHHHSDGSLQIIPKTPAEVFGERILKPLIDKTSDLTTRTFRIIRYGFSFCDHVFQRTLNFLPTAHAIQSSDDKSTSELEERILKETDNTVTVYAAKSCPAIRALQEVERKVPLSRSIENLKAIRDSNDYCAKNLCIALESSPEEDPSFSTADEAKSYIEKMMGEKISDPEFHCIATEIISQIKELKNPTAEQEKVLIEAYANLQVMADADALMKCNQKLMELFKEFSDNIQSYSITSLEPLPKLLKSLLSKSKKNYIIAYYELLVIKINEISRRIIGALQVTNEKTALTLSVEVMVDSVARITGNTKHVISTFEMALELLQSTTADVVQGGQKQKLRKIAKWYKRKPIAPNELAIADKILEITASDIWLIRIIESYLESIPGDIERFDEWIDAIQWALLKSKTFQDVATLTIMTILWKKIPRVRSGLLISASTHLFARIVFKLHSFYFNS